MRRPTFKRIAVLTLLILAQFALHPMARAEDAHGHHPADYPYPHIHSLVRDPADTRHIFALGNPEFYESFDAGQTWQVRGGGVPTAHYARLVFEPASRQLFAYTPGIPGFHRSTDGGWSWPMQTDLPLRDVVARDAGGAPQLLAVGHDLRFLVSDDGGSSWSERAAPWSGAADARMVQLPDGALLVVGGGATYRSADAGGSWARTGGWPADLTPVRLFAAGDRGDVYAIAHRGTPDPRPVGNTLLRSVDAGQSWSEAGVAGTWAAVGALGDVVLAATWHGDVWRFAGGAWSEPGAWQPWPLALVQPLNLREDVNPTPTVTDLLPAPDGALVVSTVLGMYRSAGWGLPIQLRSRGLVPTAALLTAPTMADMDHAGMLHFGATGQMLADPFLEPWQALGGLRTLGYPITAPYLERDADTGVDRLAQLFERGRLEQDAAGRVLPARLVAAVYPLEPAATPRAGCHFSAATGHNICGALMAEWYRLGAERWLGLPLGEAAIEHGVRTQLFERGRLESHTTGGRETVMLGLVGREEAQQRGWLP